MRELAEGGASERVAEEREGMDECDQSKSEKGHGVQEKRDEGEGEEGDFVRIDRSRRTETEGTLVAGDDDDDDDDDNEKGTFELDFSLEC